MAHAPETFQGHISRCPWIMEWPWALEERAESQIAQKLLGVERRIESLRDSERQMGKLFLQGKLCGVGHFVG